MPKVLIVRPGYYEDGVRPPVGAEVEVSDTLADALVKFSFAKRIVDESADAAASEVETATDPNADERETRDEDGDAEPASASAVRAWARDNGIDVPARGAIPADVREKFDAALSASADD